MGTFDVNVILGQPGTDPGGADTATELLAEMERHDIEYAMVTHLAGAIHDWRVGNELLMAALEDTPDDRLIPVPVAAPGFDGGVPDLDAWAEHGARGIRLCPAFYQPLSRQRRPGTFLEDLAGRGWFVQVAVQVFCGASWKTGTVGDALQLAQMESGLNVMAICPPRGSYAELVQALEECSNLLVDISNISTGAGIQNLVEAGYEDQLVCGSGFGVCYSTAAADMVRYTPISGEAQAKILRDNMLRLVGS